LKGANRKVHLHFDDEQGRRFLDLRPIVAQAKVDAHLYCCGPAPMLSAFEAASAGRPKEGVHVEYFTAKDEAALGGGYVVQLAKSGKAFHVPPGKSILEVVRGAGIFVSSSCEEGICGACETGVISGEPDHRDAILSDEEKKESKTMMVCCSGSKTAKLVLDL
jgi:vanillate O-demethylase ferredoxin subunit